MGSDNIDWRVPGSTDLEDLLEQIDATSVRIPFPGAGRRNRWAVTRGIGKIVHASKDLAEYLLDAIPQNACDEQRDEWVYKIWPHS